MPHPWLTGQLLMRDMGEKDGRALLMVVGIIAMPKQDAYQGEHQYTVLGLNHLQWTIVPDPIDRTQEARGQGADGLLTSPIWHV